MFYLVNELEKHNKTPVSFFIKILGLKCKLNGNKIWNNLIDKINFLKFFLLYLDSDLFTLDYETNFDDKFLNIM